MTGSSRQVILPREMVLLVLVNAANRIERSDRRVPNTLELLLTRRSYRGSVCLVVY